MICVFRFSLYSPMRSTEGGVASAGDDAAIATMFVCVQVQVLSGPSCSNLIGVLVTNLLNEQSSLQPELAAHRLELSKTSGLLNAVRTHTHTENSPLYLLVLLNESMSPLSLRQDLRALVLLLSVQPPQAVDPALCPALQELLGRCRVCVQQRSALELEAKDHKAKGNTHTHMHTHTHTHTHAHTHTPEHQNTSFDLGELNL